MILGFLSFADRTKLSSIYFENNNHNTKDKRVSDIAAAVNSLYENVAGGQSTTAIEYWSALSSDLEPTGIIFEAKYLTFTGFHVEHLIILSNLGLSNKSFRKDILAIF